MRLEYATLGWNVVEIGFLVFAAVAARSVALAGFAFDSFIEIFASIVVIGELTGNADPVRERRAVRRIGFAFFGLAIYITIQSIATVALGIRPDSSPLGIAWLAATVVVMFGLAWGKARTGAELANPVLSAEAKVTVVDGSLAAGILVGAAAQRLVRVVVGRHRRRRDHRRLRHSRRRPPPSCCGHFDRQRGSGGSVRLR